MADRLAAFLADGFHQVRVQDKAGANPYPARWPRYPPLGDAVDGNLATDGALDVLPKVMPGSAVGAEVEANAVSLAHGAGGLSIRQWPLWGGFADV